MFVPDAQAVTGVYLTREDGVISLERPYEDQALISLPGQTPQEVSVPMRTIEDCLTEDEAAVVRRARNAHQTPPKNADPADYCRATALEALFGYLYLTGQLERMKTLMYQAENRE